MEPRRTTWICVATTPRIPPASKSRVTRRGSVRGTLGKMIRHYGRYVKPRNTVEMPACLNLIENWLNTHNYRQIIENNRIWYVHSALVSELDSARNWRVTQLNTQFSASWISGWQLRPQCLARRRSTSARGSRREKRFVWSHPRMSCGCEKISWSTKLKQTWNDMEGGWVLILLIIPLFQNQFDIQSLSRLLYIFYSPFMHYYPRPPWYLSPHGSR